MTKVLVTDGYLGDIANAIRAKNGSSDIYTPGQMAGAIAALPDAPVLVAKIITANGEYDPEDDNADGYSGVTVNVPPSQPNLQSKTATENGTVLPDAGYDGLSSVVVNVSGGGQGAPYTGTTPPTSSLGSNGDIYVQTVTGGSIASDGACYIDTGIIPNALFKIELETAITQQTSRYDCLFGCRNGSAGRFLARFNSSNTGALAVHKSGNPTASYTAYTSVITKDVMLNTFYKLSYKDYWSENGLTKTAFPTDNTDAFPYSIYLFNFNENGPGGEVNFAYAKMKYFRVYDENDELVAYFVATKDGSNIPCMYDLVNGVYKYNVGAGALTYIPEDATTAKIIYEKITGVWTVVGVE